MSVTIHRVLMAVFVSTVSVHSHVTVPRAGKEILVLMVSRDLKKTSSVHKFR